MLSSIEDGRSIHGLRHQLTDVLLLCIMAIMCGYSVHREMGCFLKNNEKELRKIFGTHHGVPCDVTIRDILQDIDFDKFSNAFNQWAKQYVSFCKGDTRSTDGKAIGSTAFNAHNAYQNFVILGSIFSASSDELYFIVVK